MHEPIISVSGIRGVVGDSFTPELILRITSAFAKAIGEGRILMARDTRPSGEMAFCAAASALLGAGIDVIDVGIVPTPTALICASKLNADGCIVITASHNPPEWNGLEISAEDEEKEGMMLDLYERGEMKLVPWDKVGKLHRYDGAVEDHIAKILSLDWIDPSLIRSRGLKVVVDCCNGAGSVITPELLRRMGCQVMELYCDPNGTFPREPEPTPESLFDLARAVRENEADLGIGHDLDADRCVLVADGGIPLSEEMTFPLAADYMLSKRKGPVATTVVTSMLIEHVAAKYDVEVRRTKVGVGNVVDLMRGIGAVIGGEGTGGVIYPEVHLTSDGITSAAVILQMLAEREEKLSRIVSEYPRYHMTKHKLPIPEGVDIERLIQRLAERHGDENPDLTDGVRIERGDSWICVRKSGTEPVIRIFAEATTREESQRLVDSFSEELRKLIAE
ncbi:TPA: phosphoglucosamine mutase [Candidatus Poribacteria bacterium]|nr:phosphoglucosamine mutase [Candidatus Poribacteria bacterium]